jgi:hypothetical protein
MLNDIVDIPYGFAIPEQMSLVRIFLYDMSRRKRVE